MTIIVLCPKSWAEAPFLKGAVSGCAPVGGKATGTPANRARPLAESPRSFSITLSATRDAKKGPLCEPLTCKKNVSAAAADDRCLDRHHQLFGIGKIRLRNPDLLLEVIDHIFPQPDFRRLLGDGHLVDFVLQPKQSVEKVFWPRRTTHDIHVHWHDSIDTLQHRIGVERATYGRTRTHRDHPLGLGHLVIDPLHHGSHLQCHRAADDHQVALSWAGTKHLRAKPRNVETRG